MTVFWDLISRNNILRAIILYIDVWTIFSTFKEYASVNIFWLTPSSHPLLICPFFFVPKPSILFINIEDLSRIKSLFGIESEALIFTPQELRTIDVDLPVTCSAGPIGDDLLHWQAAINGPVWIRNEIKVAVIEFCSYCYVGYKSGKLETWMSPNSVFLRKQNQLVFKSSYHLIFLGRDPL